MKLFSAVECYVKLVSAVECWSLWLNGNNNNKHCGSNGHTEVVNEQIWDPPITHATGGMQLSENYVQWSSQ